MEETPGGGVAAPVRIDEQDDTLVAHLTGVVDIGVAREFQRVALDLVMSARNVTIDLREAERVDAGALQILLAVGQEVLRGGRSFSLTGMESQIRSYLEMAGALPLPATAIQGAETDRA